VQWYGRLVAGFPPPRPGFTPRAVHVWFVVGKVAVGQTLFRVCGFSLLISFHHYSIVVYHPENGKWAVSGPFPRTHTLSPLGKWRRITAESLLHWTYPCISCFSSYPRLLLPKRDLRRMNAARKESSIRLGSQHSRTPNCRKVHFHQDDLNCFSFSSAWLIRMWQSP
jgi:hypothetical protein